MPAKPEQLVTPEERFRLANKALKTAESELEAARKDMAEARKAARVEPDLETWREVHDEFCLAAGYCFTRGSTDCPTRARIAGLKAVAPLILAMSLPSDEQEVERVARAIGEVERSQCGGYPYEGDNPDLNPWLTDKHRMFARAALSANSGAIAELRRVLFEPLESDASYNLEGALEDLRGQHDPNDGGVCAATIERVIEQLEKARALLSKQEGRK